ncbi:MAG TPA: STT3 domain-containing protein [Thermoanaerobaculia bacterium]
MHLGGRGARRILIAVIAIGFALRLSVWPRVFSDGRVYLDGPDGYYHLWRAAMTMQHWPLVPQFDPALNYPQGGTISWPPLFDGLLATLALPFRSDHALEVIGALLPPILGALQLIVLYMLVHALRNRRAALIAVSVAAVLPAVVRYTLLGNLDHDPFFTLCLLVSLLGLARENRILVAAGLACGTLGWTGAIVQVAIVTAIVVAVRREEMARDLGIGATAAAIIVVPFVIGSAWRGATFEGLSWLHVAALAGAGLVGSAVARSRGLAVANAVALLLLLPISIRPFISGAAYAAGDAPILAMVAEAQPLLRLFGTFDLRAMLIRFGLLPVVAVIVIPWLFKRERSRDVFFVTPWLAITLALAFLHSRFSFDAGIALAAFAGIAFDHIKPAILVIALLPILPAYIPIPSLEGFNFYLRPNALRDYQMDRISNWLRARPPGAVLAPWSFGHWIVWLAKKPVVIGPMLSVGQSEFAEGLRFFFLEDPVAAQRFIASHGVRYVIVTPELDSIGARARVAGIDPARYQNPRVYARTIGARLTFFGPFNGFREVLRTQFVRVYEVSTPPPRG